MQNKGLTGLQAHNLHKRDPQSPRPSFQQIYQTQEVQPVLALVSQPEAEELQASLFYSTFWSGFFKSVYVTLKKIGKF